MREWIRLVVAVSFGASMSGCAATAVSDGAGDDSAIQGGTVDKNDAAVGLVWFDGGGFCTGTLIAPDVVLTAGHCVEHKVEGFYLGSGAGQAAVGPTAPSGMERHVVADQTSYPGFAGVYSCPASTFDIGLLKLAKAITKVTPRHVAKAGGPSVGTVCSAVGYGEHADGAQTIVEQKRRATETVTASNDVAIAVTFKTGVIDRGDSGGPLLCGTTVAGVTSCKADGDWPAHKDGVYARVDTASKWIEQMTTSWQPSARADSCAHSTCTKGAKLPVDCNECVTAICAQDPYCCTSTWDQSCVAASAAICGVSCR